MSGMEIREDDDGLPVLTSAECGGGDGDAVMWQSRYNSIQGGWSQWRDISKTEYESMLNCTAVQMGSTQLRALYTRPAVRAGVPDASAIAEETMQAWGDRVPKYSFDFRGLIADGVRRALLGAASNG